MREQKDIEERRALCQAQINSARIDGIEKVLVELELSILDWVLEESE